MPKLWKVYLSGEVHSDWRKKLMSAAKRARLPVEFYSPITDHTASDACGVEILGNEPDKFWHDQKGARLNTVRNKVLIEEADIVMIRFGDKYRQWNAAFEAGYAAALGKPIVVQHPPEFIHALKEVDVYALAVAETDMQLLRILKYIIKGKLQ